MMQPMQKKTFVAQCLTANSELSLNRPVEQLPLVDAGSLDSQNSTQNELESQMDTTCVVVEVM